ncbi:MAG TPA: SpoIID/LytB domain-containing protein [Gemmatimonadaceae bacterium]|nr:SpoIID/LytB domain-containing protein [Gemmatimonadaceae bacterium]
MRLLALLLLATAVLACGPLTSTSAPGTVADESGPTVRVVIAAGVRRVALTASDGWQIADDGGASTLVRAAPGDAWTVEAPQGGLMRAVRADGVPTAMRPGPFVARPLARDAMLSVGGKRYRGEVRIIPTDSGLVVVNHLPLEAYLRGVVPLEIGRRSPGEEAAVEAQAVAARSYAYTRLSRDERARWDLRATEMDQVYGGADAETPFSDAAVERTRGLVLTYAGRVVSAPYHSNCGGTTAAPDEVWNEGSDAPYLQRVSDRIPGTDRYYCDIFPRFRWTRTFDAAALTAVLDRYLRAYAAVPARGVGRVRSAAVEGTTPSGRARALVVTTDRGSWRLRGNEMRFVLRSAGGEILPSTYLTAETERGGSGALARLVLRGTGNGHGIGMCQWGAIGRARAGQDAREILRTYYPGTSVAAME